MSRVFLGLTGAGFVLFGLWAALAPLEMLAGLGVTASGPHALIEFRSIYGGVSLAAGALMLASLFRQTLARPALWFIAVYCGGYVAGRALSIAVFMDGLPAPYFWGVVALEAALFAGAVYFLRQER